MSPYGAELEPSVLRRITLPRTPLNRKPAVDLTRRALCADLVINSATHSGSNGGRKIRGRVCPRPIATGSHAFHKPGFPPSSIRLCVAEFMTRFDRQTKGMPSADLRVQTATARGVAEAQ